MIISVLVGKKELRDIDVDSQMHIGDLLTGLFPGITGCSVYDASGMKLENAATFEDYKIMNGDILMIHEDT